MIVGTLLVIDKPPMTGAAADAVGRTWLAENFESAPLCVLYRDVEGSRQFLLLEDEWTGYGSSDDFVTQS